MTFTRGNQLLLPMKTGRFRPRIGSSDQLVIARETPKFLVLLDNLWVIPHNVLVP
jgi:hypothetical protein